MKKNIPVDSVMEEIILSEGLVRFPTAILAKELGFNEIPKYNTWLYDNEDESLVYFNSNDYIIKAKDISTLAPRQSTLQTWIRNNHDIDLMIKPWYGTDFQIFVLYDDTDSPYDESYNEEDVYDSHEKALEAGLMEALNLIKERTNKTKI